MNIEEQFIASLKDAFLIVCRNCDSTDIAVNMYLWDEHMDGNLTFTCKTCKTQEVSVNL